MLFLRSAGAIHQAWGSQAQVPQLPQGSMKVSPPTSPPTVSSALALFYLDIIWDCMYHSSPLVWLVHHLFVFLHLGVPQDLKTVIFCHIWRDVQFWHLDLTQYSHFMQPFHNASCCFSSPGEYPATWGALLATPVSRPSFWSAHWSLLFHPG